MLNKTMKSVQQKVQHQKAEMPKMDAQTQTTGKSRGEEELLLGGGKSSERGKGEGKGEGRSTSRIRSAPITGGGPASITVMRQPQPIKDKQQKQQNGQSDKTEKLQQLEKIISAKELEWKLEKQQLLDENQAINKNLKRVRICHKFDGFREVGME